MSFDVTGKSDGDFGWMEVRYLEFVLLKNTHVSVIAWRIHQRYSTRQSILPGDVSHMS